MRSAVLAAILGCLVGLAACGKSDSRTPPPVDTTLPEAPPAAGVPATDVAPAADAAVSEAGADEAPSDAVPAVAEPAPDPQPTMAGRTIDQPDWLRQPTAEDVARYFPDRAQRMEVGGFATISCVVSAKGTLGSCDVVNETPSDMQFGDAAVKLSKLYRVAPQSPSGLSVEGAIVHIQIRFRPSQG